MNPGVRNLVCYQLSHKVCPESWSFLGNLCFTEMTTQSGLFVAHSRAPVQRVTPSTSGRLKLFEAAITLVMDVQDYCIVFQINLPKKFDNFSSVFLKFQSERLEKLQTGIELNSMTQQ